MTDFSQDDARPVRKPNVEGYRNVAAIVLALSIMQTAAGALSVVGPLSLMASGASTLKIGTIVSGYAFGFLLGAYFAPKEIRRIGHIRAVAAFAGITSVAAAALYVSDALAWWLIMQFIMGTCVAGFLASGESWVADAAPSDSRGAILSFYLVAAKIGFILGPFLVASVPPGAAVGFMIVAALYTASLIPASATNRAQPAPPSAEPYSPTKIWHTAPSAVIAVLCAGLVNGAIMQLYAVYVSDMTTGSAARMAAVFSAFMVGGGVLAQWPAGIISDRIDRRIVIAALALIAGIAALLLGLLTGILPLIGIFAIAGILGAGAQSYYGVAAAHATDRADEGQATNTMSGIITIYATGTIAGPILAGATMSLVGGRGLFLYSAVVLFALAGAMIYRRTDTPPVQDFEKSDFEPVSATSASVYELTEVGSEEAEDIAEDPADAMADSGIVLDEEDDLDETSLDDDEDDPDGYWRS
ncbi:MAG: MFS transporter [Pseudomonadota bacterium]|nr:MFS transporter [Pseudomonadota bacterium]